MRFDELGLKMGDVMQLQLSPESELRYPVKLLGFIPERSIIIEAPSKKNGQAILVKEEQMITLRFVVNSVASGFSARVLCSRTNPKDYLHIEMPKQVETVEVRNAVRVVTELPASVINHNNKSLEQQVQVTNLSVLGGRFESTKKLALIGDKVSLSTSIILDDMEKLVTLDAVVMSKGQIKNETPINWYGFHFDFSHIEDRLLIKAYVYQEILRSLHLL